MQMVLHLFVLCPFDLRPVGHSIRVVSLKRLSYVETVTPPTRKHLPLLSGWWRRRGLNPCPYGILSSLIQQQGYDHYQDLALILRH